MPSAPLGVKAGVGSSGVLGLLVPRCSLVPGRLPGAAGAVSPSRPGPANPLSAPPGSGAGSVPCVPTEVW